MILTFPGETQIFHESGCLFVLEFVGNTGHSLQPLKVRKVLSGNAVHYQRDQIPRVTESHCGVLAQHDNSIG